MLFHFRLLFQPLVVPPPPRRSPPLVVPQGGGGGRHLVNPEFFVAAHCVVVWVTVLWGTATCILCTHGRTFCSLSLKWNLTAQPCFPWDRTNVTDDDSDLNSDTEVVWVKWCMGYGTQFWEQVVFYKGRSRREMGSQRSACACQASYQEGKNITQECCPKHSSGKWRACARVQGQVEQDQENFTPSWSRSRSPYIGSPLNVSYAEFFRFMLQFLCLQMCVYSGSVFPQGGVGGLSSLGWGRTRGGGG